MRYKPQALLKMVSQASLVLLTNNSKACLFCIVETVRLFCVVDNGDDSEFLTGVIVVIRSQPKNTRTDICRQHVVNFNLEKQNCFTGISAIF
jgi:hypothetical protein